MNVERISKNEERLDRINVSIKQLNDAIEDFKSNLNDIKWLNKYYGSKEWFKDKEDYEKGKFQNLKAGVLSEDAVWNMNEELKDIICTMRKIDVYIN